MHIVLFGYGTDYDFFNPRVGSVDCTCYFCVILEYKKRKKQQLYYLCENHKNGRFRIFVDQSYSILPLKVILLRQRRQTVMTITDIQDNNQLLRFACEDLRGVQSLILTVTDHPEYANAYQVMSVIDRALSSIVNDIQEAIDNIDRALSEKEQSVQ